jgi:hypothetical protein
MRMDMVAEGPGSEDWVRRRRARSLAIAIGLGLLVVIFYAATIVRLGPNALRKESFGDVGAKSKTIELQDQAACKKAGTC